MTLFARRDVAAGRWWADLAPYLSAQAAQDYRYTDPASVPPTQLTGTGQLVDLDTSEHLVTIAHLPTDAGLYAVTLSRSAEQPTWTVERITPPETAGD